MSVEAVLLVISLLFFMSILACKAGYRFGVPTLLLFLGVGMAFGPDGVGFHFGNLAVAQAIGTVALCVILFSGGLDTKVDDIRPVLGPGLILATLGVILTAGITAVLVKLTFSIPIFDTLPLTFISCLLLASIMSSTDSAAVFSILRGKGLHLKNNLRPTLELESGSNDPMAYLLTTILISLIQQGGQPDYLSAVISLFTQLIVGALVGWLAGRLFVWIINHLKLENISLYPIAVFTACIFVFSASYFVGGNSYLAVYIGGVVMGNSRFLHKRSSIKFFDGLAWLSQLIMFLTLGLLVTPRELVPLIIPSLLISLLMIFVARPMSVFLCLMPFRKISKHSKMFISWVGLRGAVPIIFAILALSAEVPYAHEIFNIVFICTLMSLIIQGTTLASAARKLKLTAPPPALGQVHDFDMEFSDDIKTELAEINISEQILSFGNRLLNLPLPENCLAVMVKRKDNYFVPHGNTELMLDDKVLLMTDDGKSLTKALAQMGVTPVSENPSKDWRTVFGELKDLTQSIKNRSFHKF